MKLPQPTGVFNKKILKDGDWYGEEEIQGIRGIITCSPAGFFLNETYLCPPVNELMGVKLDGVLEPDGKVTVFDCVQGKSGIFVGHLPLVRRRRHLRSILEEWDQQNVRIVPNTTLLGITMQQMIDRGPTILKKLSASYGDEQSWIRIRPS